jgi:hypothetical protein
VGFGVDVEFGGAQGVQDLSKGNLDAQWSSRTGTREVTCRMAGPQNPDCTGDKYQNLHCKGLRAIVRGARFRAASSRLAVGPLKFVGWMYCARNGGNDVQIGEGFF